MYEKYVTLLKDHSIKITTQRLEILKYIDEHHTHPNAEHIYTELKKKHPALSRTTVYNSLDILQKNHLIQSLSISGSDLKYDIGSGLHHHFLCTTCGQIIDIAITCPNMQENVAGGHHVEEVHGYFKGICKTCQTKEKGRNTHG
jgi:Fur family transcriptional regulator, peroxide stress response regulator